jgi:cysteine desulfurase/selenocysteine lyase
MIYFDNAATSWPKPSCVTDAMMHFMHHVCANPGRSGHRMAVDSGRIVYEAREAACTLFHAPDSLRVVFTGNVTEALNLALKGILHPGDHVITSSMEHNSMMRPLRVLEKNGVELSVIRCSPRGLLDPEDIIPAIRKNTVLIALNHVSNVTGTIQPAAAVGNIARAHDILLLLDTAQSAAILDIDMEADCIDLLGFTGHKSLYGPTGTGGLIIGERINEELLQPLKTGGTGSRSESEEQPGFLPDRCESGTQNAVGIAGLLAGIQWIRENGIGSIREHELVLTNTLLNGLQALPGVTIYGPADAEKQTATVSFTIDTLSPSDAGILLDDEYDIFCRVGLHCSPSSHKTIGTFPDGAIRFGLGYFNTLEEVKAAVSAIEKLVMR